MMPFRLGRHRAPTRHSWRRTAPEPGLARKIIVGGAGSLAAWVLLQLASPPSVIPWTQEMMDAAALAAEGLDVASEHCRARGMPTDPLLDPLATCLIGPQLTPLFTTLGQLEAKRTALNPDVAGLLVHLLRGVGVGHGDRVAVGASGSFPGLLLATLAAVETMEARPVVILSLGASSYGATRTDFHLLDLYELLLRSGVVANPPAAASLGGEGDVGSGFDEDLRADLSADVVRAGIPLLGEEDLSENVAQRMRIYGKPAAFVNIGGAEANLGSSPRVLELEPGPVPPASVSLPPLDERGVLFQMIARGVPTLHLLNLRGLSLRFGIPWDPVSLPRPGTTRLVDTEEAPHWSLWLLTGLYGGFLLLLFLNAGEKRVRDSPG